MSIKIKLIYFKHKHMIWAIFNLLFNCYIDRTVAYIHVLFFPGNCWSFFGLPVACYSTNVLVCSWPLRVLCALQSHTEGAGKVDYCGGY